MAIAEKEPVPTSFGPSFISVDESDATSAEFQAPKKENRFMLLEMSKEQIEALEAGQLFHIKDHSSNSAALCTSSATLKLEFLENSNPMYVGSVAEIAPAKGGDANKDASEENKDPNATAIADADAKKVPTKSCTIFAQCRGHVILKPLSSDAQRVRDLLAPKSQDAEAEGEGMTTAALEFQVAASPKELKTILEHGPYVERNGVWRWTAAAFEREVTDVSLNIISANGWSRDNVELKALLKAVQKHFGEDKDGSRYVASTAVLQSILRIIGREAAPAPSAAKADVKEADAKKADAKEADAKKADTKEADAKKADTTETEKKEEAPEAPALPLVKEGHLALDPEKIKLFQATQLLREAPSRIRERFDLPPTAPRPKRQRLGVAGAASGGKDSALQVEEFAAAFSALTGTETKAEDLCKLVGDRMYVDENDGAVHTLDVTALPQQPGERLKRLFELSSHWKPDRLVSLVASCLKGVKPDVWIMKNVKTVYWEHEKGKEEKMYCKKFHM